MANPYVIVLSGQSNAMANSLCTDGEFYALDRVQVFDAQRDQFETLDLKNTTHHCTDTQVGGSYYTFGGGVNNLLGGLGRALYEATAGARDIRLICNGRGGTPISYWVGSGTASVRYANLKRDVERALSKLGLSTINAFLFQQGESDMLNGRTGAQYIADSQTLFAQLRAESWFPASTPILCGEPCQQWTDTTSLATLLSCVDALTSDADPYSEAVLSLGLPCQNLATNNIHFSGQSLFDLGKRYANALMNYGIGVYRRRAWAPGFRAA